MTVDNKLYVDLHKHKTNCVRLCPTLLYPSHVDKSEQ